MWLSQLSAGQLSSPEFSTSMQRLYSQVDRQRNPSDFLQKEAREIGRAILSKDTDFQGKAYMRKEDFVCLNKGTRFSLGLRNQKP